MALKKALTWFSIFTLMFILLFLPLVQPFRLGFEGGRMIAEEKQPLTRATLRQELEMKELTRYGHGDSSGFDAEDSAREVPTGPDPLHHKTKPTGP